MAMFIHSCGLCPLDPAIKLIVNISKVAYSAIAEVVIYLFQSYLLVILSPSRPFLRPSRHTSPRVA